MKMKIIFLVVVVAILGLAAYKVYDIMNEEYIPEEKEAVPVTVYSAEEMEIPETIVYQGSISPSSVENISFKSSARLEIFNGQEGEEILEGTTLAKLDQSDLDLALQAAENQLYAANADYNRASKGARSEDLELARISVDKATEALVYLEDQVTKIETLFTEGIVSQSELDGAKLELDLATKDYELAVQNLEKASNGTEPEIIQAAAAQVALARTNRDAQQAMIDDVIYVMPKNMILLKKLYEVGELVPAGYPVAVVRSLEEVVTIGVSGKDLSKVYLGQNVDISSALSSGRGQVRRIAEIPDSDHFLYEVEVEIVEGDFTIGDIVECTMTYDQVMGITLPIFAMKNDGIDYVYIYDNGIARIQKVEIINILEDRVLVEGVSVGEQVIVSNINRIQGKSKVTIKE